VKLPIGDGVELDGWLMTPPEFDPNQKYPLLIHVYGEPHGQTVRDAWLGTTGLWHAMLAQRGCFVASFDNRGVILPKGRTWRKSVHHKIGQVGPADQAGALKELCRQIPQIDPQRVGIWGWSGGGSSSLNAILQYPDLYQTAVAVAPVPNQKLYDTIYQERYMGLPEENAEGYRLGSPVTHAANLKGNLLIVHGTGDDNVHYQGVEQLMDALIANHRHFTVLPYANRSHGIFEGANTTRHLFTSITRYFGQHLLQQPAERQFAELAEPALPIPSGYSRRIVQGWKLYIDDRLSKDQPEALAKAVQILDDQLRDVTRLVPAPALEVLRRVNLWFSPAYEGVGARAEYHPGEGWLRENGRNPLMVKGVEFTDIPIFEQELKRMPNFVLHELAHAYHDQVLGFDHPRVQALHAQAKAGGKYDKVLVQDAEGNRREARHYALTTPMEYFAELSESYFGRNDFFPFDQAELRDHDPDMHALLGELWGVAAVGEAGRK
jgi:dipeptidyl-peptidase-4